MRRPPRHPPRDPDFDRPPSTGRWPTRDEVRYYQRLVVNPFLAVVVLAIGGLVVRAMDRTEEVRWAILPMLVPLLILLLTLVQYHCLDCGATGSCLRWREHACPRICERLSGLLPNRPGFPAVPTQLTLWVFGACVAAMLA